jgi:hypothetical protein
VILATLFNVYGDTIGKRQRFGFVPGACPVMATRLAAYAGPLGVGYPVYRLRVRARMPAVFGEG